MCGAPLRKQRGMVPPRSVWKCVRVGVHKEVSIPSPGEVLDHLGEAVGTHCRLLFNGAREVWRRECQL